MTGASIDDGFDALMAKVELERGFVCSSYKQKCLRRRVTVRMRARGVDSCVDYSMLLDRDSAEFDSLLDALTVNVTKFFRNPPVWDGIARDVVPELWSSDRSAIRAWSAGCASGEEAYSLAILFHRHAAVQGTLGQIGRVHIVGTDVDKKALAAAERAEYAEDDVSDTPADLRNRYFGQQAPFAPAIGARNLVKFAQHDLLGFPAGPVEQDLIICRNVLIYFDRAGQERVLEQFAGSLSPGGYLILGKVETLLGPSRRHFVAIAQRERIFRKVS